MINVAVINLKTLIKNTIKIIVLIIVLLFILNSIKDIDVKKINFSFLNNSNYIDSSIILSLYLNRDTKSESGLKKVLISELAIFSTEEEIMEKENQEEVIEFNEDQNDEFENINLDNNENINLSVDTFLTTKVVEENNKNDTYTHTYNSVKIKNESRYELTEDMIIPNVELTNKKDIIIYHTHTCESYTPTEENYYEASGNFRTTDLNYSVARVGNELSDNLLARNFNVIHNTTYHDFPAYTGSYTRSLATINSILKENSNSEFIIDLHRDALGSNSSYAPSVIIGDEKVAQLMFVMGTDGGGLEHNDWLYNFKFAVKIQEKANEMYPGLFKPIILRDSRYNQHVTKGACIIEVGATGNTIEECNGSMKYLASIIEEVMK